MYKKISLTFHSALQSSRSTDLVKGISAFWVIRINLCKSMHRWYLYPKNAFCKVKAKDDLGGLKIPYPQTTSSILLNSLKFPYHILLWNKTLKRSLWRCKCYLGKVNQRTSAIDKHKSKSFIRMAHILSRGRDTGMRIKDTTTTPRANQVGLV